MFYTMSGGDLLLSTAHQTRFKKKQKKKKQGKRLQSEGKGSRQGGFSYKMSEDN